MTTRLSGRLVNDNTVSPLDFGAVGDGTTDDTAAMKRAIEHLATGSKILDLNYKTYKITTQLTTIGTGGVVIRNGTFKYVPDSLNRSKPMLKFTVTQADSSQHDMPVSGVGQKTFPGAKKIYIEGTGVDVADGSYLWIEDNRFDFVYKGPNQRVEDAFPRSDRAFKGEMLKVDYSDKTNSAAYIYYLDNEVNMYYDGFIGNGDTSVGCGIKILTTIDDVVLENVNIEGPGIVRKNLGGGGAASPITVNGTTREISYGSTDHNLTQNEYITIDTGDYVSNNSDIRSVVQGVWKITADPSGNSTLNCGATGSWSLEGGVQGTHTGSDSHGLISASDVGPTKFDTWIYTGCDVGICVEYCSNFKMVNCKVTGFGESGVVTYKCYEPEFANCTFESARPEGSGGLVLGNGCYKPYVHDCEFKGYNGLTVGTTGMKVLRDMPELNISFYGTAIKALIKNNQFKVKETGIKICDNALYTEVSDNNIEVESTFAQERAWTTEYNRLPSSGINSRGVFVDLTRNTITGIMHYGVYHRQCQKVCGQVGDGSASTHEPIYNEGNGDADVGNYTSRNGLFADPLTFDGDGLDESTFGHRGIGNELPRFYLNATGNTINAHHNVPTRDVAAYSNLVLASRFGIFVENQTAGRGDSPSTFATRVNLISNTMSGHLASIRLRCVNGRFKGVNISDNHIDTKPYNDRTAGGQGQFTSGSTRPGVGLRGFYDDNTWEFAAQAPQNVQPTIYQQIQKASGLCLMIDNFDEYDATGQVMTRPNIEDVDIMNNVFTRSINWADKSPNSGHTGDATGADQGALGGYRIGGTSTFNVYFDVANVAGKHGTVRHINASFNRVNYSTWFGFGWRTRRTNMAAASTYAGVPASDANKYINFDTINIYYSNMNHNYVNAEQVGGFAGYGWNRSDSANGSSFTLPYDQQGVCGRLYAMYYWNSSHDGLSSLNTARYGSNHIYGGGDIGSAAMGSDGNQANGIYFNRSHNVFRWG